MQEQINEKSVSLIIRGTKFTSTMLAKSINKILLERKNKNSLNYIRAGKALKIL